MTFSKISLFTIKPKNLDSMELALSPYRSEREEIKSLETVKFIYESIILNHSGIKNW